MHACAHIRTGAHVQPCACRCTRASTCYRLFRNQVCAGVTAQDREDAEGGYTVIEENIIETKANEKYIIAKSVKYNNYKQRILSYWIIDKSKQLALACFLKIKY